MLRRLFGKEEEKSADDIKLEESLSKTRSGLLGRIGTIFQENEISEELWEELEEILILGDVGMTTTMALVEVKRSPVSCIPSPESPANLITTRSRLVGSTRSSVDVTRQR